MMRNTNGVITCDLCTNTIIPHGLPSYEEHDYNVCGICCAKPENSTNTVTKVEFLIEFYKDSKKLCGGIPPFWPLDPMGNALTRQAITNMM